MKDTAPAAQLRKFIAKFSPEVAAVARAALAKVRKRLPGAVELVYDNYNALAIGFGPSERASEVIASIALYPRWVSLFFLDGARLEDPDKRLKGGGNRVRHVVLTRATVLDEPALKRLFAQALEKARKPLPGRGPRRLVIKAVSAKQRPRRPSA
jgi:hypothetical protein